MSKVIKVKIEEVEEARVVYLLTSNEGIPFLYVNKYLKFLETINRSTNTIKSYAYRLKLYWDFIEINELDFRKITMDELVKYIGWLQGESYIGSRKREAKTINYNVMAIFGFYNYLARFHLEILDTKLDFYSTLTKKNYSYKSFLEHTKSSAKYKLSVLRVKETKKPYKRLTNWQLKEISHTKVHIRNRLLVSILYETGIRISEALEIKLEDIDLSDKKILITKSKTPSGENRIVYLSSDTVNLVQDYIYEVHEKNNFDSDYLFLKLTGPSRGEVCDYVTVMAFFKELSSQLGFNITPHMFRHTLATELHENGVEISIIKALLGHKDVQTTMNMYIHPSEKSIREEYNKVALSRARGKK